MSRFRIAHVLLVIGASLILAVACSKKADDSEGSEEGESNEQAAESGGPENPFVGHWALEQMGMTYTFNSEDRARIQFRNGDTCVGAFEYEARDEHAGRATVTYDEGQANCSSGGMSYRFNDDYTELEWGVTLTREDSEDETGF